MSEIDDYRWLVSDAGQAALSKVTDHTVSLAQIRLLRRDYSADRVRLVTSLSELRIKARAKFVNASQLFMTDRALQQATDSWTAAYKASQIPDGDWADACSGMGGDLMQMARKQETTFVDQDPILCLLASANVERCGGKAKCLNTQATPEFAKSKVLHIDPDRRVEQRTTQLQHMSPDLKTLEAMRDRAEWTGIKLAPATQVTSEWERASIREWIEWNGEVRQQWVRLGDSLGPQRKATIVHREPGNDDAPSFSFTSWTGDAKMVCETAGKVEAYLFEPSNCLLAAGLDSSYSIELCLKRAFEGIPYYTSNLKTQTELATRFRVEAVMPYDQKKVKQWLRQRNCGRLTVKKRGTHLRPEQVQKRLRVDGDEPITLILAGHRAGTTAILCARE